jgi:hypothetical protein
LNEREVQDKRIGPKTLLSQLLRMAPFLESRFPAERPARLIELGHRPTAFFTFRPIGGTCFSPTSTVASNYRNQQIRASSPRRVGGFSNHAPLLLPPIDPLIPEKNCAVRAE